MKWIKFPNAPITEAVLDIRAKLPPHIGLAELAKFQNAIINQYPSKRERVSWQGGFQVKPGGEPEIVLPSGAPDGYLFTSSDEKQIVQARLDGFTFSRLKPYDRWETFRDTSKNLWTQYREVASPVNATRIALRYINRIEIPLPMKDFKEYILTTPDIASGLPQGLADFFMRLVIPEPNLKLVAIVTQTMEKITEGAKTLPLIFDIDVFKEGAFDPQSHDMWGVFDQLREFKDEIFFKSITPKAKELFQ